LGFGRDAGSFAGSTPTGWGVGLVLGGSIVVVAKVGKSVVEPARVGVGIGLAASSVAGLGLDGATVGDKLIGVADGGEEDGTEVSIAAGDVAMGGSVRGVAVTGDSVVVVGPLVDVGPSVPAIGTVEGGNAVVEGGCVVDVDEGVAEASVLSVVTECIGAALVGVMIEGGGDGASVIDGLGVGIAAVGSAGSGVDDGPETRSKLKSGFVGEGETGVGKDGESVGTPDGRVVLGASCVGKPVVDEAFWEGSEVAGSGPLFVAVLVGDKVDSSPGAAELDGAGEEGGDCPLLGLGVVGDAIGAEEGVGTLVTRSMLGETGAEVSPEMPSVGLGVATVAAKVSNSIITSSGSIAFSTTPENSLTR